ncbi:MAG: phospholipid carrier-dependent glycosyltransferase [Burkholderiales bacterium]|nr:phospholipid carrier-dependent glycosyltransferase [Burkholderiales bacterium]
MSTVFSATPGRSGPMAGAADTLDRPITRHLRAWRWLYVLLGVSVWLHFWRLGQPAVVAFDESLVGEFASHYLSGTYYFDIHPPHMKLMYALLGWLGGWTPAMGFPVVGAAYPDGYYLVMRAFPALCGSLLPVLVVLLALELRASLVWALVGGWAVLLDSALLAESRFILNDIPLLFFGAGGWWCLLRWRNSALAAGAGRCGAAAGVGCGCEVDGNLFHRAGAGGAGAGPQRAGGAAPAAGGGGVCGGRCRGGAAGGFRDSSVAADTFGAGRQLHEQGVPETSAGFGLCR